MTFTTWYFGASAAGKYLKTLKAYGKSAGYAEQALSSIKVVAAFGMESLEVTNYSKYLEQAKSMGIKQLHIYAIALCLFLGAMEAFYPYGFWLGGIWIDRGYWNHAYNRAY